MTIPFLGPADMGGSKILNLGTPTLAADAATKEYVDQRVPAGSILPFAAAVSPTGWLRCDGTAVSRTTYSTLFNAICPSFTGNTTLGSNTITSVPDTYTAMLSDMIGRIIEGPAIGTGTTITSINSVGGGVINIVMSSNASAGGTGVTLRACPFGQGNGSTSFNVPNLNRRTLVGIGGTGTATLANTLAATGGAETHTLSTSEIPSHTHAETKPLLTYRGPGAGNQATAAGNNWGGSDSYGSPIPSTGGGGAHNNLQPSLVINYIIKT